MKDRCLALPALLNQYPINHLGIFGTCGSTSTPISISISTSLSARHHASCWTWSGNGSSVLSGDDRGRKESETESENAKMETDVEIGTGNAKHCCFGRAMSDACPWSCCSRLYSSGAAPISPTWQLCSATS